MARWPTTRWPLSIALSEDDGLTWPWVRDIDTGDGFSGSANWYLNGQLAYPSVVEGLPGELHIAYSWGNRAAIRYVMINEHNVLGTG
jgi:predicted neuraminidase